MVINIHQDLSLSIYMRGMRSAGGGPGKPFSLTTKLVEAGKYYCDYRREERGTEAVFGVWCEVLRNNCRNDQ